MKDAIRQEINVGDKVIACGGNYAAADVGIVLKVTRVKCTIDLPHPYLTGKRLTTSRHPDTLVVVTENLERLRIAKNVAESAAPANDTSPSFRLPVSGGKNPDGSWVDINDPANHGD